MCHNIKMGKTLGYAEAQVTDKTGKLLAHGTSTIMILQARHLRQILLFRQNLSRSRPGKRGYPLRDLAQLETKLSDAELDYFNSFLLRMVFLWDYKCIDLSNKPILWKIRGDSNHGRR